ILFSAVTVRAHPLALLRPGKMAGVRFRRQGFLAHRLSSGQENPRQSIRLPVGIDCHATALAAANAGMETAAMFSALMADYLPFLSTVALVVAALGLAHWWLIRRTAARGAESQLPRQLLMLLLTLFGLILALL